MDIFWKAIGASMIALVLGLVLEKRNPDVTVLLNLVMCSMLLAVSMEFLRPVLHFLQELAALGGLADDKTDILLRATAIGIISQIAGMLCADSGNSALGKGIETAAACAILWISLPLLSSLAKLMQEIIGQL